MSLPGGGMKGGKPGGGAPVPGGIMPPGMNGGRGPPAVNGLNGGMFDGAMALAGGLLVSSAMGDLLSASACMWSYLNGEEKLFCYYSTYNDIGG